MYKKKTNAVNIAGKIFGKLVLLSIFPLYLGILITTTLIGFTIDLIVSLHDSTYLDDTSIKTRRTDRIAHRIEKVVDSIAEFIKQLFT